MSSTTQDWRPFLRALAEEMDAVAGIPGRDALLRRTGTRLAGLNPLPPRTSTEALQIEMNESLSAMGLGEVTISFSEADRCLYLSHRGLPRIGGGGTPPGTWLGALLEGLYESWFAQQPGANKGFVARRATTNTAGVVLLRYAQN